MLNWLEDLLDQLTRTDVVLATVVGIDGTSPDAVGSRLLITKDDALGLLGNPQRTAQIINHARQMLTQQSDWSLQRYRLEPVMSAANGFCEVFYQKFLSHCEHWWIRDSLNYLAAAQPVTLEFEYPGSGQQKISLLPEQRPAQQDQRVKLLKSENSTRLRVNLGNETIKVAVAGSTPLAMAISHHLQWLPALRYRLLDDTAAAGANFHTLPLHIQSLAMLPLNSHLVVATGNHQLDTDLCRSAVKAEQIRYVGCPGSDNKASAMRIQLIERGVSYAAMKKLHCPIGLPGIVSKDSHIVAISVLAQILDSAPANNS